MRTEKGKIEKYYKGELAILLAYKKEASKVTSGYISPDSKEPKALREDS